MTTRGSRQREAATLWRPDVSGVEVLHASFLRHAYPRHSHDAVTVALVDHGTAAFECAGRSHVASQGSVFVINAGAVHTGRSATPQGYRYRVLYLTEDAFSGLPGRSRPLSFPTRNTVLHDRRLAAALDRVHGAMAVRGQSLHQEEALLGLGTILRHYTDARPAPLWTPRDHRAVTTARDYLEADPAAKVTLAELARLTSTSQYRLVRMFAAEYGMPPHAYQMERRVRLARRLLESGSTVVSAAGEAGFCDQAHLTRVFKRYTGVTPGRFLHATRPAERPGTPPQERELTRFT